jgi:hypothetical protein
MRGLYVEFQAEVWMRCSLIGSRAQIGLADGGIRSKWIKPDYLDVARRSGDIYIDITTLNLPPKQADPARRRQGQPLA